jgi:hypothetical protein
MTTNRDETLNLSINRCDRFIRVDESDPLHIDVTEQWHRLTSTEFSQWLSDQAAIEGLSMSVEVVTKVTSWVGSRAATPRKESQ